MKLIAKCLVTKLSYGCKYCKTNERLKDRYLKHLLIPVCLKEYAYNRKELYFLAGELFGGDGKAFVEGKAKYYLENGIETASLIADGLNKIEKLMDSMGVYEIILPRISSLCGTEYISDGTFQAGFIKGKGILPAFLENI
jgi:hypothetical protein